MKICIGRVKNNHNEILTAPVPTQSSSIVSSSFLTAKLNAHIQSKDNIIVKIEKNQMKHRHNCNCNQAFFDAFVASFLALLYNWPLFSEYFRFLCKDQLLVLW